MQGKLEGIMQGKLEAIGEVVTYVKSVFPDVAASILEHPPFQALLHNNLLHNLALHNNLLHNLLHNLFHKLLHNLLHNLLCVAAFVLVELELVEAEAASLPAEDAMSELEAGLVPSEPAALAPEAGSCPLPLTALCKPWTVNSKNGGEVATPHHTQYPSEQTHHPVP